MGAPLQPRPARRRSQAAAGVSLHESTLPARVDGRAVGRRRRRPATGCSRWSASCGRDVVHLNQFAFGALPFARADAGGRALVRAVVVAGGARRGGAGEWDRYRARGARRASRGADLVVAPTRGDAGVAAPATTARAARRGAPQRRAARRDFAPGGKQPFILAAGRLWDEAKNLRALEAGRAAACRGRCSVAGADTQPDGGTRAPRAACIASASCRRDALARRAGARRDLRPAGALRALRPVGARGRALPAARWCWATSPACARSGARPRVYVPPDDHDGAAAARCSA